MRSKLLATLLLARIFMCAQQSARPKEGPFWWAEIGRRSAGTVTARDIFAYGCVLNYSRSHMHYQRFDCHLTPGGMRDTLSTDRRAANRIALLRSFSLQCGAGSMISRRCFMVFYTGLSYKWGLYRGEVKAAIQHPGYSSWLFGYISGKTEYKYDYRRFHSIGVPLAVTFTWAWFRHYSVGTEVYVNVSRYTDAGVAVKVGLGNIRKTIIRRKGQRSF